MIRTAKQFETDTQIAAAFDELTAALSDATAQIERIGRLKDRLATEAEAMRSERDAIEIYDEAEAAALLRIEPRQLADLRRRLELPHIAFGPKVRYSKQHIGEIVAIFSTRKQERTARLKAA
jgi:hypothetical protein